MSETKTWAMVEICGPVRRAGLVSEVTRYGASGIEVRVPKSDGTFQREFYAGRALFAVHHVTEAEARRAAGLGSAAALPGRGLDNTHPDDNTAPDDEGGGVLAAEVVGAQTQNVVGRGSAQALAVGDTTEAAATLPVKA